MADVSLIPDVGLPILATMLVNSTTALYLGWGTGTTEPVVGNTGLQTAASESRVLCEKTLGTQTLTNDSILIWGELECIGASKDISEMGIFTATSGGTLVVRVTFTPITVAVGQRINFVVKIPVARGV